VFPAGWVSQPGLKISFPAGLTHRVWCFSDRIGKTTCVDFEEVQPSRLRREGWVRRTECPDSTGHCRLFVVPGVGPSGFNDVPVWLGPSSDGLMTTRWMTPGLESAVSMEAANWASQRHLKARSARADSLARLAFGNSRHRAFRPLSEMYRSVPDHGFRSWRRAPGIP
jgi:hypothetical protein